MDLSALNFGNSLVYKRFEFNQNAKPRILMEKSTATSTDAKHKDANKEASVDEKHEYEKVFNARVSDEVKRAEAGMTTIYFRDPITQKLTRSALSGESLSTLGREFGSDDLTQRADGSYILSGKAENFVAGWYADIAYTRGYLKADKNGDGFYNEQELKNVRSGFTAQVLHNSTTGEIALDASFVESYIELGGNYTNIATKERFEDSPASSKREFGSATIGIELDKTIKNDKNLDGKITYEEIDKDSTTLQVRSVSEPEFEWELFRYRASNHNIKPFFKDEYGNYLGKTLDDEKTSDMLTKKALDRLGQGVAFDDLDGEEQAFLKFNLADELFDKKYDENGNVVELIFNEEKFQKFYAEFKESFKQRSAEFLGLSSEDASKLDYENLSQIVDEIYSTYISTNATSVSYIGDTINLRNKEWDTLFPSIDKIDMGFDKVDIKA